MSLFARHATKGTIEEVAHMVEHYFKGRGLDPRQQHIEVQDGSGWWLTEGSARIYVFLQNAPGGPVLRVTSPLVYLPENHKQEFFHNLLKINADLTSCALAISDDAVIVVAQRHTAQLDQEELEDLVWNVAYIADLLDDKLVTEYGAKPYRV